MSLIPEISEDESFEKIKNGFKINLIQMKDGDSGKMMWDCKDWDFSSPNQIVKISKELLKCKIIKRNVKPKKMGFYLLKFYLEN